MPNWIKDRADAVRETERLRKEEFHRKSAAALELKTQLLPFWTDLISVLKESVRAFNSEFPEADRMIDRFDTASANAFSMSRTAYPAVTVKAQLNNAGTNVQYAITRTQRKGMNSVESQDHFAYEFADGQATYSNPSIHTHEDVAKILMDAFFDF